MLIDILKDIAVDLGLKITNQDSKDLAVLYVNNAAFELYNSCDLIGSLREQVFNLDTNQQQLSFPYYIGEIRGIRNWETNRHLVQNDMRPRFFHGAWLQPTWSWRAKDLSPIERDIVNTTQLTITLLSPSAENFTVTVVGSTGSADQISEVVTFNVGDLVKTTTNQFTQFPGIQSIVKNVYTTQNLTITDANAVELAMIPNHYKQSIYTIVQVTDQDFNLLAGLTNAYEILYKLRFRSFVNDNDPFMCSGYDDAIKWMALSHYYAKKVDSDGALQTSKADAMRQMCYNIVNQREADYTAGVEKNVQMAPNQMLNVSDQIKFGYNNVYPFAR